MAMQIHPNDHPGEAPDDFDFCPLVDNPRPDCYCHNLNSQNAFLATRFCHGNFRNCDVYQREVLGIRL